MYMYSSTMAKNSLQISYIRYIWYINDKIQPAWIVIGHALNMFIKTKQNKKKRGLRFKILCRLYCESVMSDCTHIASDCCTCTELSRP